MLAVLGFALIIVGIWLTTSLGAAVLVCGTGLLIIGAGSSMRESRTGRGG